MSENEASFISREQRADTMCPFHEDEIAYVQTTVDGDMLYSCRKTGQRIFDQDAVE